MKRANSENEGNSDVNEPYISRAYIHNFLKQTIMRGGETTPERELPPPPPPQKKARRRLPARRPYQEKLLNMAEARREIVAALKLHRATMEQHHRQQQIQPRRLDFPGIYAPNPSLQNMYPCLPYCISCWPAPPPPPPPPAVDAGFLDFSVPWEGLGLNLNVDDLVNKPYPVYASAAPSPPEVGGGFEFSNYGGEEQKQEEIVTSPFDEEVVEFPPWLNEDESSLKMLCVVDSHQDSVLPW